MGKVLDKIKGLLDKINLFKEDGNNKEDGNHEANIAQNPILKAAIDEVKKMQQDLLDNTTNLEKIHQGKNFKPNKNPTDLKRGKRKDIGERE